MCWTIDLKHCSLHSPVWWVNMHFESTRVVGIVQNKLLSIITTIVCQLFIPPTDKLMTNTAHEFRPQLAGQYDNFIALFSI